MGYSVESLCEAKVILCNFSTIHSTILSTIVSTILNDISMHVMKDKIVFFLELKHRSTDNKMSL